MYGRLKKVWKFALEKSASSKYKGFLGKIHYIIRGIGWILHQPFSAKIYGGPFLKIEALFVNYLDFLEKPFKKTTKMDLLLIQPNGLGDAITNKAYTDYLIEKMSFQKSKVLILATETWKGIERELCPDISVYFFNIKKFETNFYYRLTIYRDLNKYYFCNVICNLRWKPRYVTDRLMLIVKGNKAVASHEPASQTQKVLFEQWCKKNKINCIDDSNTFGEFIRIPNFYRSVFGTTIENMPRRTLLKRSNSRNHDSNYFVFHVGNSDVRRRWGVEKFLQVGEYFAKKGYKILIVGGYCERDLIDAFGKKFEVIIDQLTLSEYHKMIGGAAAFLGGDTGPTHMAVALNIPTAIILGGGHYNYYLPYPPNIIPEIKNVMYIKSVQPCYGCDWHCTQSDDRFMQCIHSIEASDAIQIMTELLDRQCH